MHECFAILSFSWYSTWSEFSSLFHYSRSCRILKKLILHSNFCLCSRAPQVFLNNTWTQSVLWTFSAYFIYLFTWYTIYKISSAQKWENNIQNFQFYVFNNAAVRLHTISFDNKIFQMSLTILYSGRSKAGIFPSGMSLIIFI